MACETKRCAVLGAFRRFNGLADACPEQHFAVLFVEGFYRRSADLCAVNHSWQHSDEVQLRVGVCPDELCECFKGLQAVHTELLCLHGYQHPVRSGEGIDKERSEGRQAVDQHEVIRSDHIFREYPAENMLL